MIDLTSRQIFAACRRNVIDDSVKFPLFGGRTIRFEGRMLTLRRLRRLVDDVLLIESLLGEGVDR